MIDTLMTYIQDNRDAVYSLFRRFQETGKSLMLRTDLWDEFTLFCEETENQALFDSPLAEAIAHTQEAAIATPWLYLDVRPRVAQWHYLRFHFEAMSAEEVGTSQFLNFKESLVNGDPDDRILEIDPQALTIRMQAGVRHIDAARELEKQAVRDVLDRADVLCATTTFDRDLLGDRHFDMVVIDEVSMLDISLAALLHHGRHGVGQVDRAVEQHAQHPVPAGEIAHGQGRLLPDGGAVDQDIEATGCLQGGGHSFFNGIS